MLQSSIPGSNVPLATFPDARWPPPLLTVITPCLEAVTTLADTLISVVRAREILLQAGEDLEHLVIDGGSRDGTLELIRRHAARHPFCRWQEDIGGGPYAAMNLGLRLACGHYTHILNSDDFLLDPDSYVAFLLRARRQNATVLLSSIGYFRRPECCLRAQWIVDSPLPEPGMWHEQLRRGLHYPHPGFLAETSLYRQTGFDEKFSLSADYKLMQTILLRPGVAQSVHVCSVPLVAMAEGGATSGWRAILQGRRQLKLINEELKIVAPAWRRYLAKVSLRLGPQPSQVPLPYCQGEDGWRC